MELRWGPRVRIDSATGFLHGQAPQYFSASHASFNLALAFLWTNRETCLVLATLPSLLSGSLHSPGYLFPSFPREMQNCPTEAQKHLKGHVCIAVIQCPTRSHFRGKGLCGSWFEDPVHHGSTGIAKGAYEHLGSKETAGRVLVLCPGGGTVHVQEGSPPFCSFSLEHPRRQ